MQIIELAVIFLSALIMGGWMATMVVFARGYKRLSAASYIEVEQTNSRLACKYFAPTLVVTALAGGAYLIKHGQPGSRQFITAAIGTALLVLTAIFVKAMILPMNDDIQKWSPTNPPINWQTVRVKWIRLHAVRTVLGLVAFFLLTSAIIWK